MQIKFDANKKKLDTNPVFGLLVQGENLAESIQITGPKMVGALDLSQLRVAVRMTSQQYETTVEKTLDQTTDGDTITFTWQVDKQFTGSPGKVDVMLVGYGGNEEVIKITSSGMVVQEDKTFGAAPPESTWEQLLQQMQDFATQAYKSKTEAENSAAAAAESQRVTEEKAAQATEAASTAAAQAAAKTEQQIRQYADDRYARPLVTKTGPAASLEVYPDKLSNLKVYANGFTTQAGTGDPSPVNVRALTNGGLKLVAVTFDGSSDESWKLETLSGGTNRYYIVISNAAQADAATGFALANWLKLAASGQTGNPSYYNVFTITADNRLYVRANNESLADFKSRLAADPLTVWYATTDGTGSLYAPIILQGGEYRATCLPLTAPLCEGDSVVSWVKSGCDKVVPLSSLSWVKTGSGTNTFSALISGVTQNQAYSDAYPFLPTVSTAQNCISVNNAGVFVTDLSCASVEDLQSKLAQSGAQLWYRSTNYTPAADIPVSLETHQQAVLVLDGTENWATWGIGLYRFVTSLKGTNTSNGKCSHMPYVYSFAGNGIFADKDGNVAIGTGFIAAQGYQSVSDWKSYLAAQYAAGTPVTIVYQLATPITYAHPAVVLPALPDDTGKVTITGQSGGTVTVVFNKSIIKEIAEIKAAMLAMGANLSM